MGGNSSDKPDHCIYLSAAADHEDSHKITSSLFLGPQAENMEYFRKNISGILDAHTDARLSYKPEDGDFITASTQESRPFIKNVKKISDGVQLASACLARTSVPFWSPRYAAHMLMEPNMPALLGYFMTMLYNPNNVTFEVSPLTTIAEIEVGLQLCKLFGYNVPSDRKEGLLKDPNAVVGWGHVVSGGSVANLESMWSARALKFYPLALQNAIKHGRLSIIGDSFAVETCVGPKKLVKDLSTWELLNLKVPTVLGIPQRLYDEHGISPGFLQSVMEKHSIQSTGQGTIEQQYRINKPIQFMVAGTRHYSWPKGGAIIGIGSDNMVSVDVDHGARIDIKDLERRLDASLKEEQAVFAVVANMGTTEEGGVDPLRDIVKLREKFQAKGLSFVIHADAAWGGYFASMLPPDYKQPIRAPRTPPPGREREGFVPVETLRAETQEHLYALRDADSVTVDPHKAGYIPYPAGGLCYRDERQKYLITWTSPYITRTEEVAGIGIFGAEGSKPGAAAMSTYFSNTIIGMDHKGYGSLLGQVSFTCSRLSAHWASMHKKGDSFILIPFNLIPSEQEGSTPEGVEKERQYIRDHIIGKSNRELIKNGKAMNLLQEIGSDLNINILALNFWHSDGTLNTEVEEANYLNKRVVERFSINSPKDDPTSMDFFLSSTEFTHRLYGKCAQNYKKRLGLDSTGETELFVLRNVVMSPWPTDGNFVDIMASAFKSVVLEEVEICRKRNEIRACDHSFILHGTDKIYLVHRPKFHLATHRRQLILSAELDDKAKKQYIEARKAKPKETFILEIYNKDLKAIVTGRKDFDGVIRTIENYTIAQEAKVSKIQPVKDRPLNSKHRDRNYPSYRMPFYLYGTPSQQHIDHVLTRDPNISLSAPSITLKITPPLSAELLSSGCILFAEGIDEASMQPFPPTSVALERDNFFFRPKASFAVTVYRDTKSYNASGPGLVDVSEKDRVGKGEAVLGLSVHVDSEMVNRDPFEKKNRYKEWEGEFDCIRKALQGK